MKISDLKMYEAVNYAGGFYLISGIGHSAINGNKTVLFLLESMTESIEENGIKVPKQICKYIDLVDLELASVELDSNEASIHKTLQNKGFFDLFKSIDPAGIVLHISEIIEHFEVTGNRLTLKEYFKFRDDAESFESDYDEDYEIAIEENPEVGISLRTALDMLAGIGIYD